MTVAEILQFADRLVLAQTGKHLDDLQETVIKGVWQGQTYEQIADECNRSESRVRDVGYKLWQILSEQLGEDVNKCNFRSTIERIYVKSSQVLGVGNNHKFNFCPQNFNQSHQANQQPTPVSQPVSNYRDLTLAPKIIHFYGREKELKTLSYRLLEQNTRLFSVLGLPGIGKTTLVKYFVDLNLQHFDVVIWKSIKLSSSLDSLLAEILLAANPEMVLGNKLNDFFKLLCQKKCLIILDDVQELFIKKQLAGQYKSEYQDCKALFARMPEIDCQSSLILMSQEQSQEMLCLDEEFYPIQCLELEGLDHPGILKNHGLKDEENWSRLIDLYEGNPGYLKDIASLIKNLFFGNVSEFLAESNLIITEDMKYLLSELFNRLSSTEQQITLKLSQYNEPISRDELRQILELSSSDLMNGLQSLTRRYLLKRIAGDRVMFNLSPVFKEYVSNG